MSTDALREALQQIIATYDEWANNTDPDFTSARMDAALEKARAALAAPASETEKLPAKWMKAFHEMSSNFFGNHDAENIANTYRVCAEELEEALKKDKTNEQ
jgi:hypothetical protein